MNKTYFYLLVSLLLIHTLVLSQRISIGMQTGITYTDITGRFNYRNFDGAFIAYNKIDVWGGGDKLKIGKWKVNSSGYLKPNFGLVMNYQINNHFTLQSELNYEEKGFDFHYVLLDMLCNGNYKFNYLSVPVLFSYEIGKSFKFYLYEGISINVLTHKSDYIIISNMIMGPGDTTFTIYNESYSPTEINKKEVEAALGIGAKIPISSNVKFVIGTRYSTGITRAAKNTFNNSSTFQNVFNRSITASWGVLISINKKKKLQ